ncbi:ABC transporter permease subunit [Chitinolyticbacter albus]|uniref:ABC transporter permease subunit n=1 Tax=Chitinolyticbacter albus TaxID=2961951 RepID=UPI002109CABB|nr:ABC transporter permease subunit [Chitinolyticbacter albus]
MMGVPEYTVGLRLCIRIGFLKILAGFCLGLAGAAWLAGEFSGRQPATVALDVGLSFAHFAILLLGIVFAQELFAKEFERKYSLITLSYPISRRRFVLARFAAAYTLLIGSCLAMALSLVIATIFVSQSYEQARVVDLGLPYVWTWCLIALEAFFVLALATLFACVARSQAFVLLSTVGLFVVARSFSAMLSLIEMDRTLVEQPGHYQVGLETIGFLLPDLSAIDIRAASLYASMTFVPENWWLSSLSVLFYALMLLSIAIFIVDRKDLI